MKKFIMCVVMLLLAINITACGSSNSAAKPEDTQKKIEDAGWKIELKKNPGTEVIYSLDLIVDKDTQISLSRYKGEDESKQVTYFKIINYVQHFTGYDISNDTSYGLISTENHTITCARYNITDKKEDDRDDNMGKCTSTEVETLTKLTDEFKEFLDKNKLTYEDIQTWGNWYYENN